jgi:hypothetical protein
MAMSAELSVSLKEGMPDCNGWFCAP